MPHDGIDDVVTSNIRIYQHNGHIVVEEADGGMLPEMVVYDVVGRRIGLLRPAANNLGEK